MVLVLVAAIAVGSILAAAIIYFSTDGPDKAPLTRSSTDLPSSHSSRLSVAPTTRGIFRTVEHPCAAVSWAPIATEVGRPGNDPQESISSAGAVTTMRCSAAIGEGENRGVAMAQMTIVDNSSAEGIYEGLQRAIPDAVTLTPISDLGTAAYAYVEKGIGPAVVTYDGNMHLRLVWVPLHRQPLPMYGTMARALAEVARQVLEYLRV
ncbi:hypothetical protein ACN27G_29520 [Plantactinospora sp. WMMB334]|uniref:hypothetical protein n=1 Tax=Plantactinospora sp. WMMB334 TaxID=3404119 RepID=UPI003B949F49